MQYSPKLKKAMEEIKAVVAKYDIGAFVVIHTPGHSEFLNKIDPSYSCAIPQTDGIRFKAKAEMYEGGGAERNQKLADTFNLFTHMVDVIGMNWVVYDKALKILPKHDSTGGDITGHDQQNN